MYVINRLSKRTLSCAINKYRELKRKANSAICMLMSVEYSVSKLVVISKEQVMGIMIPIEGSIELTVSPDAQMHIYMSLYKAQVVRLIIPNVASRVLRCRIYMHLKREACGYHVRVMKRWSCTVGDIIL